MNSASTTPGIYKNPASQMAWEGEITCVGDAALAVTTPSVIVATPAMRRPMLYEKPAPVVRSKVGKSGGTYSGNKAKMPELKKNAVLSQCAVVDSE